MAPAPQLTFDLIDSTGYGYHRVWQERAYLLRLAAVPLFIKFILTVCVYSFDFEGEILRRGLIMLPAAFAEGWLLAQFLRTLLMEERWPMPLPSANDELAIGKLILRARGIISATLVYVLIALAANVLSWGGSLVELAAQQASQGGAETKGNPLYLFGALFAMMAMILAFPLLWAYIPYAVLMPLRAYLQRVFGLLPSIRMFGVFLICMVPFNVLAALIAYVLVAPYGDAIDAAPAGVRFFLILVSVCVDLLTALIVTAGMAYALRDVIPRHPAALADVKAS